MYKRTRIFKMIIGRLEKSESCVIGTSSAFIGKLKRVKDRLSLIEKTIENNSFKAFYYNRSESNRAIVIELFRFVVFGNRTDGRAFPHFRHCTVPE
jgi:hypothetical protein